MKNSILCILLVFGMVAAANAQDVQEESGLHEILHDDDYNDAPEYDGPSPTELYKQESVTARELDRNAWRKATEGLDYSGGKKKKKTNEGLSGEGDPGGGKPSERSGVTLFGSNAEVGAAFLKILVGIIAAVALFFLLRSLLGMKGPRNRKVNTAELLGLSLEDIEENFQELALEDFIRNAIERKEFALAIRLYYLAVLKELAAQELIRWKKDKTNLDYIREMRPTNLGAPFREITRIFEWAWYGQQPVSEADFTLLEPKMKGFLQQVASAHPA